MGRQSVNTPPHMHMASATRHQLQASQDAWKAHTAICVPCTIACMLPDPTPTEKKKVQPLTAQAAHLFSTAMQHSTGQNPCITRAPLESRCCPQLVHAPEHIHCCWSHQPPTQSLRLETQQKHLCGHSLGLQSHKCTNTTLPTSTLTNSLSRALTTGTS